MLQAMNTGHDGSMTTCHANSAVDAFSRLETMVMMGTSNVPDKVVRQMLASAVHIIVQMNRLMDGSRKIMSIAEVRGVEGDHIVLDDVFTFEREGVSATGRSLGRFRATGHVPRVLARLKAYGIKLPKSVFEEVVEVKER
jgi:pilus assembly protein CpaF